MILKKRLIRLNNNLSKMGIQYLNSYVRKNCPDSIRELSLSELCGKKIAIDTSIYMYRFAGEGSLIDGMYQMVALLRYYNITPVFIFDGIAPPEKYELLKQRKLTKDNAEEKYNDAQKRLQQYQCHESEFIKITTEMKSLRKQFVKLKTRNIIKVKQLLNICGVTYIEAEGEADKLCAKLVIDQVVYACLSEDMDMFVYGCPRILRYFSIINSSVVMYDFNEILKTLQISSTDFKEICVISGTDYNINNTQGTSLIKTIELFNNYKQRSIGIKISFYDWLKSKTNYIKDYNQLKSVLRMFDLSDMCIDKYNVENIMNSDVNEFELRRFLYDYDFIFV